jgi:hypothetical protein
VSLASRTDYLWRTGKYLLEVGGSANGDHNELSVALPENPDSPISSIALGSDRVLSAEYRDGYVYVLQRPPYSYQSNEKWPAARLSIFNADSAPKLVKVGETTIPDQDGLLGYAPKFLWPQPGTLVLSGTQSLFSIFYNAPILSLNAQTQVDVAAPSSSEGMVHIQSDAVSGSSLTSSSLVNIGFAPIWLGSNSKTLFAVDVSNPRRPEFLNVRKVKPRAYASFSDTYCADGKVYFSYQYAWFVYYWRPIDEVIAVDDAAQTQDATLVLDAREKDFSKLYGRHFLQVIDYTNPAAPKTRPPVSSPGVVKAVVNGGKLLYMSGPEYGNDGRPKTGGNNALQAVSYDGGKLELAASASLGANGYLSNLVALENRLFVNSSGPGDDALGNWKYFLSLYEYDGGSQFKVLDQVEQVSGSQAVLGNTLVSTTYDYANNGINFLDFSNPTKLTSLGRFSIGWLGVQPERAAGNAADGFWFPLGLYGVLHVELPKQ